MWGNRMWCNGYGACVCALAQALPDWALHAYLIPLHKGLRARYQRKLKEEEAARSAATGAAGGEAGAGAAPVSAGKRSGGGRQ